MVVLAGQQCGRFHFGHVGVGPVQLAVDLFQDGFALGGVGLLMGQMEVGFEVTGPLRKLFIGGKALLGLLALPKDPLGLFGILPEVRLDGFLL